MSAFGGEAENICYRVAGNCSTARRQGGGMASFAIGHALQVFSGIQLSVPAFMMLPEWSVNKAGAVDWRRHMRNIVDEVGEIIAKTTDDHTLIGGHHRLAVAASLGRKLFWKDTGEPVKLDPFFKGSSHRDTA
jgi:hypothetical protein